MLNHKFIICLCFKLILLYELYLNDYLLKYIINKIY